MSYFQSGNVIANQCICQVASGTAPLVVSSTTKVDNLNVDKLDGYDGSFYTDATNLTGILPNGLINDSNHGSRSGGTLHAIANLTTAGFMSATSFKNLEDSKIIPVLVSTATTNLEVGNLAFISYNGATLTIPSVGNVSFGSKILICDYKGNFDQSPCVLASNLFEGTQQQVVLSIRKKVYSLYWIDDVTGWVIL